MTWVNADAIFDGRVLRKNAAIRIEDGHVAGIAALDELPGQAETNTIEGLITPGFFDIQVNGGGGVLFNTSPTAEALGVIAAAHASLGTTAILPTVITDAHEVMEQAADAVLSRFGRDGIRGIHIEGPHISLARRGTHNPAHVRPLDEATFAVVERLRAHRVPVLITLAPEAVSPGQIARLVALGAVVSIGHSDASLAEARAAEAEGARLYTHLYNAMSPMLNRAPGITGAAITSQAYCSVICDGIHATPEMLSIAMRARPIADRMILISDAMPTVGGPASFDLYGQPITLSEGRLINQEGSLAGAHTTMALSVAYVAEHLHQPLDTALRMAITNPAELLSQHDLKDIVGQPVSGVVVLAPNLEFRGSLAGAVADTAPRIASSG